MPAVHFFASYPNPKDLTRKPSIVLVRDPVAAFEVMAALQKHGYLLGSQKLNYPPQGDDPLELMEIDVSDLCDGDLLVTFTRPPISDEDQGERKYVARGYTSLERIVHDAWLVYVEIVSRSHVKLREWLHPLLPAGFESRRDMYFLQTERSDYLKLNACDGSGRRKFRGSSRTAAFLLNHPQLWPGGPGYLGLFGLDGASTLAWACLLRHRYPELLVRPGFHMVELHSARVPKRVGDLRWALDWRAELLLSVPPPASAVPLPRPANPGPKKSRGGAPRPRPAA